MPVYFKSNTKAECKCCIPHGACVINEHPIENKLKTHYSMV